MSISDHFGNIWGPNFGPNDNFLKIGIYVNLKPLMINILLKTLEKTNGPFEKLKTLILVNFLNGWIEFWMKLQFSQNRALHQFKALIMLFGIPFPFYLLPLFWFLWYISRWWCYNPIGGANTDVDLSMDSKCVWTLNGTFSFLPMLVNFNLSPLPFFGYDSNWHLRVLQCFWCSCRLVYCSLISSPFFGTNQCK